MAVSVLVGTLLEADAPMNPAVLREAVDSVVTVAGLPHVGTDPETYWTVRAASARCLDASGRSLAAVAADLGVAS